VVKKSIRRVQLEGGFEKLLGEMKPSKEMFFPCCRNLYRFVEYET